MISRDVSEILFAVADLGPSVADFENMFSKRAYDKPYQMAANNPFSGLDALGACATLPTTAGFPGMLRLRDRL